MQTIKVLELVLQGSALLVITCVTQLVSQSFAFCLDSIGSRLFKFKLLLSQVLLDLEVNCLECLLQLVLLPLFDNVDRLLVVVVEVEVAALTGRRSINDGLSRVL